MDKQSRIDRIVGQFLRGRFSAATEERVQRWLVEPHDEAEKEAASLEFWDSLDSAPNLDRRSWERIAAKTRPAAEPAMTPAMTVPLRRPLRRAVSIAASILVPLMVVAGGLVWRAEVKRTEAEVARVEAAKAEATRNAPLAFEGASVDEILTALEARFDVTITADEAFRHRPGELYTVKFPKEDSLENILDVLGDVIGKFEYTKTGSNITIITK